jgi:hypothetical protein
VDIFLDKRPITSLQDNRLNKLKEVWSFFNVWEHEIPVIPYYWSWIFHYKTTRFWFIFEATSQYTISDFL